MTTAHPILMEWAVWSLLCYLGRISAERCRTTEQSHDEN